MRRRLELAPLLDGSRPVLLVASSMWQLMPWQIAALGSGYLGTPCAFTRSLSLAFPTELDARSKRSGASPARVKAHLYSPSAPNLLLTSEEVAAVAALLADRGFEVPTFNDSSASVGSLTGSSLRDDLLVLHFAGHSEFDAIDSGLSRLLLSKPGRIAASSWLTAAEIEAAQTSHGPQLVYLSSCKSALTENRPGDEPIGLVKAFFSLGAEALICTTWETLDSSAKDMSTRFYTALLEGNTVAEESGRVASCQE